MHVKHTITLKCEITKSENNVKFVFEKEVCEIAILGADFSYLDVNI